MLEVLALLEEGMVVMAHLSRASLSYVRDMIEHVEVGFDPEEFQPPVCGNPC